jgi:DNA polymerase II small subunit/DNA polymerase delta subunit B
MKNSIIGRPIRLNRQILNLDKGKKYASVVFLGDAHYGSPQFDKTRFLDMVNFCAKNSIYVFLMGDK